MSSHCTLEHVYTRKTFQLWNLTIYRRLYLKVIDYLLQIDISLDNLLQCVMRK